MPKKALEGIKVADFSWVAAGPYITKYLADFGAQVIKVESSKSPDLTRMSTPYKDGVPGLNRSGCFFNINSSKYSICINLGHPRGPEVAKKLVAWADVVVDSFKPGVMKKWGLDYEEISKIKSDSIVLSSSWHGQTGPLASQTGFGYNAIGYGGFSHLTGWPDRGGAGPVPAYTDVISPWFGVVTILAALDYRSRSGKGVYIDLSQLEAGLYFLRPVLLDYIVNGREQVRCGNRSTSAAPHGAYPCKGDDRWVALGIFNDQEWASFCRVIGKPAWSQDPRFANCLGRVKAADELDKLVEAWTINHLAEDVMSQLQSAGIPCGIVQKCEDLMEHDPQLRHRHTFWSVSSQEMGVGRVPGSPAKLSKTPEEPGEVPCLGQHTEYVCTKILGMSDEEFVELAQIGALE